MSENITIQISGSPESVLHFLNGLKQPQEQKPELWWKTEIPWFERHGKLAAEEAADLEAGVYGARKGTA